MKSTTTLILMFAGAGVASAYLLGDRVAEATSESPFLAGGAEGLVALGGGYWAWKKGSKVGAVVGGVAAGLLAMTAKGALLVPPSSTMAVSPMSVPSLPSALAIVPRHPTAPTATHSLSNITYSGFSAAPGATIGPAPELLR